MGYLHVQPWKDAQWEEVYVHLSKEHLLIRRRDLVYEDTMANNVNIMCLVVQVWDDGTILF